MSNKSFEGYQILDNEGPTVPNGFKFNALNGSSIQIELNLAQWKRISNHRIVSLKFFRVGTMIPITLRGLNSGLNFKYLQLEIKVIEFLKLFSLE